MTFPTADHVAIAIVTAARLVGENPLEVVGGGYSHARHIAMEALVIAFPDARRAGLGRCCGYPVPRAAQAGVFHAKRTRWWSDDLVDEVVGAVVAERYGEQAA